MAVGVPVVSSNTGGIPEVNIHGESGFLSDVGDIDDMAQNLEYLLTPEVLEKFKIGALNQAKAFSLDQILPQYEELYRKLVQTES